MTVWGTDGVNTLLAFIALLLGLTAPVTLWFCGSQMRAKASSPFTPVSESRDNSLSRDAEGERANELQ
jgi:hypothetical protein